MYEIVITTLVSIGLLASAIYVLTWTPAAIRARRHRATTLTALEVVDFAALPGACFIVLVLSTINILASGIPVPGSTLLMVQRVFTAGLITAIVVLRLVRWGLTYKNTPPDAPAPL